MQLVMLRYIEDTDLRVLPGDAPQVSPFARALQFLRTPLLLGLQGFKAIGIDAVRHTHVRENAIQYATSSLSRVVAQLVRIQRHADARASRQMHMEIAEVQWLGRQVVG